ncbi:hypothetical protein F4553_006213 [Allocatelliglobosispora scoriae]|uniref:Secreted protein n=1 Tax=Allocatelliglobosispora scoriae TaxID=643052 RepID=A0A841C0A4_9ACTN|nr:hypothetical protein [Allocatelliglobosispora scoriae]MBB5872779.1 hypothetical protein [Allocatelliglobosispora scoriae]
MKRLLPKLIVAIALALTGQAMVSTPAHAATVQGCAGSSCTGTAGFALWNADGDALQVCDMKPDGKSVVVLATIDGVHKPYKWHTAGSGSNFCTDRSYGNVDEGLSIYFTVCLGDYSDGVIYESTCGYQVHGTT